MKGYLDQLRWVGEAYQVPIIIAGDIFHVWNSPAMLINHALEYFPTCYAIPGQHDLPYHNYNERHKSAYWTLVQARVIHTLEENEVVGAGELLLHGFPFGSQLKSCKPSHSLGLDVAVVHSYIWKGDNKYPGAEESSNYLSFQEILKGYDFALFGDNHKGFVHNSGKPVICNTGTLIRTKLDEVEYRPFLGLLRRNGKVSKHYLDTSNDRFLTESILQKEIEQSPYLADLLEHMQEVGDITINFVEAIQTFIKKQKKVSPLLKAFLLSCIGG